jgi:hypothetical protein
VASAAWSCAWPRSSGQRRRVSRSTGVGGRSTITCSLAVGGSARRRGGLGGSGVTAGGWMRTRPTAPLAASTYQGPASPRITAERGGRVTAEAAANARGSPAISRRPPACQLARPLCTRARSTSATRAADTQEDALRQTWVAAEVHAELAMDQRALGRGKATKFGERLSDGRCEVPGDQFVCPGRAAGRQIR